MDSLPPSLQHPGLSPLLTGPDYVQQLAALLGDPARLDALQQTALLNVTADAAFDRLTRLAAKLLDAPVAMVNLVNDEIQLSKSVAGLPDTQTQPFTISAEHSFCKHAMAARAALVVDDARRHPLLHANPMIAELGIVAYVGIPLILSSGHSLGALCVIDHQPRNWSMDQVDILADLTASVITEIELRNVARTATALAQATHDNEQRLRMAMETARLGVWDWEPATGLLNSSTACKQNFGLPPDADLPYSAVVAAIHPDDRNRMQAAVRRAVEEHTEYDTEYRIFWPDGSLHWISSRAHCSIGSDGALQRLLGITLDITARKQAEASARRSAFLAKVGERLADTLEYDNSFARLAQLAVPELADWGIVDILETDGSFNRRAIEYVSPASAALARRLGAYAPDAATTCLAAQVAGSGQAELVVDFSEAMLTRIAQDDAHRQVLVEIGIQSIICVPLRARGRILGTLTFLATRSGWHYESADLELAEELGRRAGIVLENARLYNLVCESEAQFRQLADAMPQIVWTSRPDGHIDYYNRRWYDYTGCDAGSDDGSWTPLLHPDDMQFTLDRWEAAVASGRPYQIEHRFRDRHSGGFRWHLGRAIPVRNSLGDILRWIGTCTDIDDLKRADERLRSSEERYRALYEDNPAMYFTLDSTGLILSVNDSGAAQLGYAVTELINQPALNICYPDDRETSIAHLQACCADLSHRASWELRKRRKDGSYLWVRNLARAVREGDGDLIILILTVDISLLKHAEELLVHRANHDSLTGLANQARFISLLRRAFDTVKRRPDFLFAVLFLDLDRFKIVNDSLGHMVGDRLLVALAQRLESSLRPGDTVARFGGDEFIILLDDIQSLKEATRAAERIHHVLSLPFHIDDQKLYSSVSIGIALNTHEVERPEDILRDADIAMYSAKKRGRACYEVFDKDMHAYALELLERESDLRRAVEHVEMHLHYQPIVSLATGAIIGMEALARWQHPQRGLVYPNEFIPLAEETGLIKPLGELLLREACTQLRHWQVTIDPALSMSVNCSALQFQDLRLVQLIATVLRETGVAPHSLRLEITESVAMKDIEFSIATLHELKAMGVHIAIDDFGTGYSSLSYLKRFPISSLKIDHSFVKDMTCKTNDAAIIAAIIAMAHSLGLTVIAEGVETPAQLELLRAQNCDAVQGYVFSKPVSAEALGVLLHEFQVSAACQGSA